MQRKTMAIGYITFIAINSHNVTAVRTFCAELLKRREVKMKKYLTLEAKAVPSTA